MSKYISTVRFRVKDGQSDEFVARPQMITSLDSVRDLLEEISPELGVTDPVSGPVVLER